MVRKNTVLVPLFSCSLLLVMGALNHQPLFLPAPVLTSFVAQPISLETGLEGLTAGQVLARAIAKLDPDKLQWLALNTWQKQTDDEVSFEAEGRLVRGPNGCARQEVTIRTNGEATSVVTVSDGVGLANARRLPGRTVDVVTMRFVNPDNTSMTPGQVDMTLSAHGCGGPFCLLQDLERNLVNMQRAVGTWNGKPVIRVTGSLKDITSRSPDDRFAGSPKLCHLYLDARSLWPHRVEWLGSQGTVDAAEPFLQLEFRAPVLNQALSHDECVREFTYSPE